MDSSNVSPECEWAAQQFCEARAGGLDAAAATALRAHLQSCPRCRADEAWDGRLGELIRDLPLPRARGSLLKRVQLRLQQRRRWRSVMSVAAAALLAAGFAGWFIGSRAPRHSVAEQADLSRAAAGAMDVAASPVLFAAPPVDSFELIARQQAGFVSVLQELERE